MNYLLCIICFLLSQTLGFFYQQKSYEEGVCNFECTINKRGIDSMELGKFTFKDVLNKFKYGKTKRKKVKRLEKYNMSQDGFEKYIEYKSLGLYFSNYEVSRCHRTDTIKQIFLLKNCPCKTKDGLGIGSSYSEIVEMLGKPKFSGKGTDIDGIIEYKVHYDGMYFMLDKLSPLGIVIEIGFY